MRQNEERNSEAIRLAKEYYDRLLGGCEPDCLPPRDVYEDIIRQERISMDFVLNTEGFKKLRDDTEASSEAFFTAVMGFVAARYIFSDESVITAASGDGLLPFVTNLSGVESVSGFLSAANTQLLSWGEHSAYTFSDACKDHGVTSAYEFIYQDDDKEAKSLSGERPVEGALLLFKVSKKEDGFTLELAYHADSYSREFAEYMAGAYIKSAKDFIKYEKLSDIELADSKAQDIIGKWNQTDAPYDDTQTVVSLFESAAESFADNTAVIYKDKRITYKELEKRTRAIAAYIHGLGLSRGDVVSILIPRGEYQAVASLGALRAGCAYQPLDDTYPEERLNFMVQDAGAGLLITTPELSDKITDYDGKRVMLTELHGLPDGDLSGIEKNRPDDLFILLYTSGSTGVPKGVRLLHRNLVCFISWYNEFYHVTEKDRIGQYASYGFDACMMDMYPALSAGAGVCIIPEELRLDLIGMDKYMSDAGVSIAFMTTQVGRQYAGTLKNPHLRALSTGGEKLASMAAPGGFDYYNLYGPTECTILSTYYKVNDKEFNIPIGRPLDNVKCYVVDANG